jgi:hypothetical protein
MMSNANLKMMAVLLGLLFPVPLFACFGGPGNLWDSWSKCSIVVLGKPVHENHELRGAVYSLEAIRFYKGYLGESSIKFRDIHSSTTCALPIPDNNTYLLFLQTTADRERCHIERLEGWTVLQAFKFTNETQADIEEGISAVKAFDELPPDEKKPFLLEQLKKKNPVIRTSVVREVLMAQYPEARQYFREQLTYAETDERKVDEAEHLRALKGPYINAPEFAREPVIAKLENGSAKLAYELDLNGLKYQSLITWYRCKDTQGSGAPKTAVTRAGNPDAHTFDAGEILAHELVDVRAPDLICGDPGDGSLLSCANPWRTLE